MTYVRSTENGDKNAISVELITVLDNHVRTADQIEIMSGEEVRDNLLSETVTDTSFVRFPVLIHVGWIRPEEIVEQSVVGNIGGAGNVANIVHVAKSRRKTAVNAEDLASNNSSDRETVECIHESLPDLDIAPALALIVETVDPGNVGAFVVAAEQEEVLGVLELVAHQKQDGLERLLSTINIVAKEEVVGVRREAAHLEHANQVSILAVDIADNLDGRIQFQEGRLR